MTWGTLQKACGAAMRMMRVAVPRRRGPAVLRNAAAVTSTCFEGALQAVAETAENTYPP